jgi:hypothetical protein
MTVDAPGETATGDVRLKAPGWPEILAGGAAYAASFLLVAVLLPLVEDAAVAGRAARCADAAAVALPGATRRLMYRSE